MKNNMGKYIYNLEWRRLFWVLEERRSYKEKEYLIWIYKNENFCILRDCDWNLK